MSAEVAGEATPLSDGGSNSSGNGSSSGGNSSSSGGNSSSNISDLLGSYYDYYYDVVEGELDVDAFIAVNLGPKHLDLGVAVPITLCYCCMWIFGMAGGEQNTLSIGGAVVGGGGAGVLNLRPSPHPKSGS